jgi:hypothetical protein
MLKIVFALALIPLSFFVRAFALKSMWFWFIVPLGVPAIGMAWAYGLSCLISLMTYKYSKEDSETHSLGHAFNIGVLGPLFVMLIGYIAHLFM